MGTLIVWQMLHLLIDSSNFLILCVQLNESNFKVLVVTHDSSVVLNQLHVDEQGIYRCSLQGQNGDAFYQITFHLTGESCSYTHHPGKIVRYVTSERNWRQFCVQVNLEQKNKTCQLSRNVTERNMLYIVRWDKCPSSRFEEVQVLLILTLQASS